MARLFITVEGRANEDHFATNQRGLLLQITNQKFARIGLVESLAITIRHPRCSSLTAIAVSCQQRHTFRGMVTLQPLLFGALRHVGHIVLLLSHKVHVPNNPTLWYLCGTPTF